MAEELDNTIHNAAEPKDNGSSNPGEDDSRIGPDKPDKPSKLVAEKGASKGESTVADLSDSGGGDTSDAEITGSDANDQEASTNENDPNRGIYIPEWVKKNIKIVVAGKSGAGKSTLINSILNIEEDIDLDLDATTQDCITKDVTQNDITIEIVDTPGMKGEMVRQLKALSKYAQSNADLLVYCLSIGPGSKFDEEKGIMRSLQDVYGADIWKYCLLVLTFANLAHNHYKPKGQAYSDPSAPKYKEYVTKCANKFKSELQSLGIQSINVKTIFEEKDETLEKTIIAIPAGYDQEDPVLPEVIPEGDVEGWRGQVFLGMLKKCRDSHKEALLQYCYGRNLVRKELKKARTQVLLGASGSGAGIAVAAGIGSVAGIAGGPPGIIFGGLLGATVGIVAAVTLGGTATGIKNRLSKKKTQ